MLITEEKMPITEEKMPITEEKTFSQKMIKQAPRRGLEHRCTTSFHHIGVVTILHHLGHVTIVRRLEEEDAVVMLNAEGRWRALKVQRHPLSLSLIVRDGAKLSTDRSR